MQKRWVYIRRMYSILVYGFVHSPFPETFLNLQLSWKPYFLLRRCGWALPYQVLVVWACCLCYLLAL
jgi:hypothetical protein